MMQQREVESKPLCWESMKHNFHFKSWNKIPFLKSNNKFDKKNSHDTSSLLKKCFFLRSATYRGDLLLSTAIDSTSQSFRTSSKKRTLLKSLMNIVEYSMNGKALEKIQKCQNICSL